MNVESLKNARENRAIPWPWTRFTTVSYYVLIFVSPSLYCTDWILFFPVASRQQHHSSSTLSPLSLSYSEPFSTQTHFPLLSDCTAVRTLAYTSISHNGISSLQWHSPRFDIIIYISCTTTIFQSCLYHTTLRMKTHLPVAHFKSYKI